MAMIATTLPSHRIHIARPLMRSLLLLCLAVAGLPPALSQDADTYAITPYDCIDPNNREITSRVQRGALTTLCLYVGPGGDWNSNIEYKRFTVNLQADEFSSYEVPESFKQIAVEGNNMFNNNNGTHIFAASQASLSFLRRYYDKTTERIYPYLTAIIDVKDGVVVGIAWDDACVFCEQNQCLANTYNFDGSVATSEQISQKVNGCFIPKEDCRLFAADGSNVCNLKLFVVWTGTDIDGKVLLSSDSRFSMFPPNRVQENVKGKYDSMVKNLENFKGKLGWN